MFNNLKYFETLNYLNVLLLHMHSRIKRLKLILRLQLSTLEVRQTNPVLCANVRISWFSSSGMKLVKLASEGLQA